MDERKMILILMSDSDNSMKESKDQRRVQPSKDKEHECKLIMPNQSRKKVIKKYFIHIFLCLDLTPN